MQMVLRTATSVVVDSTGFRSGLSSGHSQVRWSVVVCRYSTVALAQ